MKKLLCLCFSFVLAGLNMSMAFEPLVVQDSVNSDIPAEVPKTVIHANNEIELTFARDFDVNQSNKGDIVKFVLNHKFTDVDGDVLPAGTKFFGTVDELNKSKFGFRKASAGIKINKMVLPDGTTYLISAKPEKELTSTKSANVAKGAATAVAAAGVGMLGAAVVAVECLSIGGMIFAPYTGAAVGIAVAGVSKGVNYKVPAGTKILFKFDKPVNAI